MYCSALLASRAGGLKGCSFEEFLKYLLRELDYNGKYGYLVKPEELLFSEEFPEALKKMKIPFLMNSNETTEWPRELLSDLANMNIEDINVGYAIPSLTDDPAEFIVKDINGRIILVGECKLYSSSLEAQDMRERIVKKFDNYPDCRVFLTCAPDYAAIRSTAWDADYCIWITSRVSGQVKIDPLTTDRKFEAKKHVILLQLSSIFSGLDDDFYSKAIQSFLS